jgi:hypothetical protein
MRKLILTLVGVVLLATAGFAGASIATGKGVFSLMATTTATTGTTGTTTTPTTGRKVTICHRTHRKNHPFRTIRVSRNAVAAHLRHGDHLGACTAQEKAKNEKQKGKEKEKQKGKGNKGGNGNHGNNQGNHGNGNGNGNNGNGNGNGGNGNGNHGNGKKK